MSDGRSSALRRDADALQRLVSQQRLPEAVELARAMTRRFPAHGLGWKSLGALLWWQRRGEAALEPMRRSVRLLPMDAEAHSNLGLVLLVHKRSAEAQHHLLRATQLDPRCAAAHYHLGMAWMAEHRLEEAESSLLTAVSLRPDYLTCDAAPMHSDLLFLRSHNAALDGPTLFAEHCRFGELLEPGLRLSQSAHSNLRDPERTLRIGFVSGDFYDHSVAMFLEPLLARLRLLPALELHAYYNHDIEDPVTVRLRAYFDQWRGIRDLSDAECARCIANDHIDILIDLSGHTHRNRLRSFARKPAPIQVSWLGYPGTTGLQTMDYYVADRLWLPGGLYDGLFTEKLAYLPDRWSFEPYGAAPPVNALPALETGRLTFGSFHRVSKLTGATVRLWSQLLNAMPEAALRLIGIPDGHRDSLAVRFAAHGVPVERLRIHEQCATYRYLEMHHQVDIALDAHPYSGGTTTMHSLSMGVPTLTLAGSTAAARAGAGIMHQLDLPEFVAESAADFVRKGAYWSSRLDSLAEIRGGLRRRLGAAACGRHESMAAHFAAALRHMWRRWCAGLAPESFDSAVPERLS